jgi:CheY-like chemotaxis protein
LLSAGFSVIAAYNGVHAIKLMERRRLPDVIVLGLGPHPGLDLYDELRTHADRNRIPVVVVVAGIDLSPQQQARFPFLLHAPVVTEALVFAVDNALRRAIGDGR